MRDVGNAALQAQEAQEESRMITADEITPRLFMGPIPPSGSEVAALGFSVLVLAATKDEYRRTYHLSADQTIQSAFTGNVCVYVLDLDDDFHTPLTRPELSRVSHAVKAVKTAIRLQKMALVTCMAGRNRSGLVTALSLRELCRWNGMQAMARVRLRRKTNFVLSNPQYERLLDGLPAPLPPVTRVEAEKSSNVIELPRSRRMR